MDYDAVLNDDDDITDAHFDVHENELTQPLMTLQMPTENVKHVSFSEHITTHNVTAYSVTYGRHPRTMVAGKFGRWKP